MARKLRIEFPDAVYHVLNRGNYRRDLFTSSGEAGAFVSALEEATEVYGWQVHAYAVMRNHYHVALRTPQPNLIEGMHWLQTTFATRFNRLHGESGHLFQGRYKSLLVEDDAALARLVDYIHLNPVRAGIVPAEQAAAFRWGSLGRFVRGMRFARLEAESWMRARGLTDNAEGWATYLGRLQDLVTDKEEQDRLGWASMSRGWAIGTQGWRRAVARDHAEKALNPGLGAADARALREARWAERLEGLLNEAGQSLATAAQARKSAPWKVEIAARVRQETGAAIVWLAETLSMGKPSAVRSYLSRVKSGRVTINQQTSA
jgi:REP element-mobilizing transposase RayT